MTRWWGQVAEARNRLLEQSYASGLAEMASGALHNIRNALTPVTGGVDMLQEDLGKLPAEKMAQALDELKQDDLPAERRQALQRYVQLGGAQYLEQIGQCETALLDMSGQLVRIETILGEQDKFSHAPRAAESQALGEALSEAVSALPEKFKRAAKLAIDDGVAGLPAVCAERIVLSHVLANLLGNAAQAVIRAGRRPGRIEVNGGLDDEGRYVYLEVRDDGDGIESEALGRIFERDCPTRRSAALHEGLHWCANAVASMQGRLIAKSEGSGRGACLRLILPAHRAGGSEGRLI